MTPGESTLALVQQLYDEDVNHIVLLMRHSAREFAPNKHDLLNPLTDEGRDLARSLGAQLPKALTIRGYSSPAERCVETVDLIMAGHESKGGEITRNRPIEALGVFYVLDQMKMYMAMQKAGGMVDFLQTWFNEEVTGDILMPADIAAKLIATLAAQKLKETAHEKQLDLLVSHDFTLYTIKDRLLRQDTSKYPDVHFLDGIALFERDGKTWIQSHHEPAVELNAAL